MGLHVDPSSVYTDTLLVQPEITDEDYLDEEALNSDLLLPDPYYETI
jgi:hypothetical protein